MAQLFEDLPRASSEIKRVPVRDAVEVIGRIISRKFLARKLLLHGRVRVDSSQYLNLLCGERDSLTRLEKSERIRQQPTTAQDKAPSPPQRHCPGIATSSHDIRLPSFTSAVAFRFIDAR